MSSWLTYREGRATTTAVTDHFDVVDCSAIPGRLISIIYRESVRINELHSILQLSTGHPNGTVRHFVEYWHPMELNIPDKIGGIGIRERAVLEMERETTSFLM